MEDSRRMPMRVGSESGATSSLKAGWCPPALRKTVVAVAGFSVLTLGVAFIFLPAPSIVVIPLGLAILAREFLWARRLRDWSRDRAHRLWLFVRSRLAKPARVPAPTSRP